MTPPGVPPDPDRDHEPDRLDIDAAFAEIVAHWEIDGDLDGLTDDPVPDPAGDPVDERPQTLPGDAGRPTGSSPGDPPGGAPFRLAGLAPEAADQGPPEDVWDTEEHYVPPEPPPLPPVDPRRRVAWVALLGSPVLALLLVVVGVVLPPWGSFLLVLAFVGGFAYLVATMRAGPPDDWSGDDGAVV